MTIRLVLVLVSMLLATSSDAGRRRSERIPIDNCTYQRGTVSSHNGASITYYHPTPDLNIKAPTVPDHATAPPPSCDGIDVCEFTDADTRIPSFLAKRRPLSDDHFFHSWTAVWDGVMQPNTTYDYHYHWSTAVCELRNVPAGEHRLRLMTEMDDASSGSWMKAEIACDGSPSIQTWQTEWSTVRPTDYQEITSGGKLTTFCNTADDGICESPMDPRPRAYAPHEMMEPAHWTNPTEGGDCLVVLSSRLRQTGNEWVWHHAEAEFLRGVQP